MFTDMAFATTEAGHRRRTLLADAENFRLARLARRTATGRRAARGAIRPDPGPTSSRPVAVRPADHRPPEPVRAARNAVDADGRYAMPR